MLIECTPGCTDGCITTCSGMDNLKTRFGHNPSHSGVIVPVGCTSGCIDGCMRALMHSHAHGWIIRKHNASAAPVSGGGKLQE